MVKVRAATVASMVLLLGTTLSATLADDSWGDMAQYTSGSSVTQEQQSTKPPANWEASKKSDDNDQKSGDDQKSDGDRKDSNSWTPAPADSSGTSWTQAPASSWESSGKSDGDHDDDNKSDTSSSSEEDQNSWTQTPTTSSGNSDDDKSNDNTDGSSESTGTSESSGDSWKQEPVASSGGSQTTGGVTSSTGSQTTGGGGGGSSTPSSGGGKVPDGIWPTSTGSVQFTKPRIIKAGEVFDGKMQTFDRSDITCSEGEGQKDSAVFLVEAGGTLKNAIIGKNQKEGVHCDDHDCTIENVWWDDVCEDALSIKGGTASSVTTVTNCGARYASDKVVQHNGYGTVKINGFFAQEFGKLYRSCGTCGDIPRVVTVKNVYAVDPIVSVITVNKNYGDKATLSNIWVKTSDGSNEVKVCQWSQGNADGEPKMLGNGPSPPLCQYSESDVHINQDISQAGGSSPSTSSAPATSSAGSSTSQTQPSDSSDNGGGGDDTSDAPTTPSDGSQTQPSAPSTKSSDKDDGGDDNTDEPVTSSGGSQTSGGATSSTGSKTTGGGGGSTPPSGGGKVPDGTWPTSTGTVQFAEAHIIKAGKVFDGKMQTFERSDIKCKGQTESGSDTAVFKLEPGATLKNAIIGKNQMEGVHCDKHDCTIDNVWWDDVCEDALSIKGGNASSVSKIIGGGARYADDKVIQHNGYGTVEIDGFYGEDISKLYRSCGTCGDRPKKVSVSNTYIVNPDNAVVTVNKNWGDEATLSNIWIKSTGDKVKICQWSQGNADGEPKMLGNGPSPPLCQYSESDVHINQDISQAGGSSPSTSSAPATSSTGSSTSQTQPSDSSDNGGGGDDTSDAPTTPSDGSQTQPSAPSTKSSDKDDGGDDNTDEPVTSSGGSQTSGGATSSTGSKTTGGGGGSTPPSGGGKVPDGTWPTSTGTVQFAEAHIIKAGKVFDGKMQTFERSDIKCKGQTESGSDTAVFKLEPGATLKNAIIGKNQMEGVHCDKHDCTIDNVWWDDVCEDALSIKGGNASSVSTVTGGGARSADDKVIQHNGYGTVKIDGFYGEDISKLYRSCGTCGDRPKKVSVSNTYIVNPDNAVVTVNKNWGDEATLSNIWIKSTGDKVKICQWSQGNADGEPKMLGNGPSPPLCQYSESDVHINGDVSQAGGSTPSTGSTGASSDGSSAEQVPGTVAPASSDDDDEGGNSTSQKQWSQSSSTSSKSSGNDNSGNGGDKNYTAEGPSTSDGDSNTSTEDSSKSSDDNNGDDNKDKESSGGDNKSDEENSDSTQQQETSTDDQSVMQSEVAGEAGVGNETLSSTPTDVDVESAAKGSTVTSTTPNKKCNVRRKRN